MEITDRSNSRLIQLPYHQDILQSISGLLIARFADATPNLSRITILVSEGQAISPLRQAILKTAQQASYNALLGPNITTFASWVSQHPLPPSHSDIRIASNQTRELMLVEALKDYPGVYNECNPWLLASNLIPLFDELTRQHISLPDSLELFIEQLEQAYGIVGDSYTALNMEAALVYNLWLAMQTELRSQNAIDEQAARILRLKYSLEQINPEQQFIVAGQFDFTLARHGVATEPV